MTLNSMKSNIVRLAKKETPQKSSEEKNNSSSGMFLGTINDS